MVWLIHTPETHRYLLRRWSGQFNVAQDLFNRRGEFKFEYSVDAMSQVLWAYALHARVDLIHVYKAILPVFANDPQVSSNPNAKQLLGFIQAQIKFLAAG